MKHTTFIFAGIISAVIGTAFAAGENTVTSKSYVDTQDALKQNKITSKTSGNVVTYNGTDANGQTQFDERGIFDYDTGYDYDNDVIADGHEGDLVTAGDVIDRIEGINSDLDDISNQLNDMPTLETSKLTCANAGCTLWTIQDRSVYGKCQTAADCPDNCPADNPIPWCSDGRCACVNR